MTQHSHFWVFIGKNSKMSLEGISAPHVRGNIIHNSQEVRAPQMSTDRWADEHLVVYAHNGMPCSLKKEGNPVTFYTVAGSQGPWAKQNKPVTKGQMLFDSTQWSI